MPHHTIIPIATQEVMTRLYSEGWINCSDLSFPALSQVPLSNLREFVLSHLHQCQGWMWKADLDMTALVFSIRDHEFQTHPHLQAILQQLQREGWIELKWAYQDTYRGQKKAIAIALTGVQSHALSEAAMGQRLSLG